jgi:small subunit ribosomal protein S20
MSAKEQKKNEIRNIRNKKYKTLIKNQFKKIDSMVKSDKANKEEDLKILLSEAQRILDKASRKGVIHKNKSSRKKSRIYKLVSSVSKR